MSRTDALLLGNPSFLAQDDSQASTSLPLAVEVECLHLYFSLLAAVETSGSNVVQVTGASRGVGTTFLVRHLADAGRRAGGRVVVKDIAGDRGRASMLFRAAAGEPPPWGDAGMVGIDSGQGETPADLLLFDCPPLSESALGLGFGRRAAGTVVVVEAERTTRSEIETALRRIEQCGGRCLGLILNKRKKSLLGSFLTRG